MRHRRKAVLIAVFLSLAAVLTAAAYKVFSFNSSQLINRQTRLLSSSLPRIERSLDSLRNELFAQIDRFATTPGLEAPSLTDGRLQFTPGIRAALSRRLEAARAVNPAIIGAAAASSDGQRLWEGPGGRPLPPLPAGFRSSLPPDGTKACSDLAVWHGSPYTICAKKHGAVMTALYFDLGQTQAEGLLSLRGAGGPHEGDLDFYLARQTPAGAEVLDNDPDHPMQSLIRSVPPDAAASLALRRSGVAVGTDHYGSRVAAMSAEKAWLGWHPVGAREIGSRIRDAELVALLFCLIGCAALGGTYYFANNLMREAEEEASASKSALGQSRRMLDKVTQTLPTGIYIFDLERGAASFISPAITKMLGYSAEEVLGGGPAFWTENFHPEDLRSFSADLERFRTMKGGETWHSQYRFRVKSGDYRWFRSQQTVFERDERGNPRSILGSLEDCTEEVVGREALTAALARARLLAQAVSNAAESIVITDPGGTVQFLNPAAERSSGFTSAEAVGKHARIFKSGRQGKAFYRALWDTILRGEVWHGTFVNKRKGGALYEEEASIAPVRDDAGDITNFVAVKRDVSRERSLEAQLTQAQKLEAVGRLAGGVAHDFNNILTSILGYAQLAKDELPKDDPLREDIDEIEKGAKRASDLTRQLLIFSRKQVIQPRLVDPGAVVGALQKMLHRIIGENYRLVFTSETSTRFIKADPSQLEQVVMNFVVNSRDALPGGGDIHVSVKDVRLAEDLRGLDGPIPAGSYAELSVKDSGTGISKEDMEHVFEPFFTTKAPGHGTGLGLATVYGIVKQGRAYLTVDSAAGEGTRMTVYWPHCDDSLLPEETERPRSRGGSESILLVEDEGAVRRLSERLLTLAGYSVTPCASPQEAIAKAAEGHKLLFTDVVMPGMSGKELAERLRRDHPSLKVLYTSGYSDEIISKQGMLEPGARLLQKPFSQEELFKAVRDALDS